ncbi:WGR domain-containing protein [Roseibacillus persicicus]|uniref:ATP-dependent DNA ligase n=1 Tax=Roseibacillus persicicus TaxID=454148 RepID=UPI00398B95BF
MNSTSIQSTTLYFREGNSDKVYQVSVDEAGDGFTVNYAYGRRGSTLKAGTKTQQAVSREQAEKLFANLVQAKEAKGYNSGDDGIGYRRTAFQEQDTGIRCQLLNSINEMELHALLLNSTHCLQEKLDGRRMMLRKTGDDIIGINRRGLVVALPHTIHQAASQLPGDFLMDGEAIGDVLHVFDLLEHNGEDLRERRYIERHSRLIQLVPTCLPALQWVSTAIEPQDKYETYHDLVSEDREGIVFKDINAPYSPGRPNSGGSQLKYKFHETASFIVTGHNTKRSVALGLYESSAEKLKPSGNVTIPPGQPIPEIGGVVEVRYLYAFRESGAVYQPTYLGIRSDLVPSDCLSPQLKYKAV